MNSTGICFILVILVIGVHNVIAGPRYRVKRVTSDDYLADLETRIALNNRIKGIAITMPVGGGRINPLQIGRKRRSQARFLDVLFNQSEEDRGDPIEQNQYDLLLQKLQSLERN